MESEFEDSFCAPAEVYEIAGVRFVVGPRALTTGDHEIRLNQTEGQILLALLTWRPSGPLPDAALISRVSIWDPRTARTETVRRYVNRLRKRLESAQVGASAWIERDTSVGYRLNVPYDIVATPSVPVRGKPIDPRSRTEWRLPSAALDPAGGCLTLIGRTRELGELDAWLRDPTGPQVVLLSGSGGAGKTRLVHEWMRRAVVLDLTGAPRNSIATMLRQGTVPVVWIDYAGVHADIALAAAKAVALGRVGRLLLTARSTGSWWTEFLREARLSFDGKTLRARVVRLRPLLESPGARREAFRMWRRDLARALGRLVCDEPVDLDWRRDELGLPLDTALEAAASLLVPPGSESRSAIDIVVDHEESFWSRCLDELGVSEGARVRRRLLGSVREMIALIVLLGGTRDRVQTARVVDATWCLESNRSVVLDALVEALVDLYPPSTSSRHVAPLTPDRLGEAIVGRALAANPHLVMQVEPLALPDQLEHVALVLARSSARWPSNGRGLAALVREDPERFAPICVRVATRELEAGQRALLIAIQSRQNSVCSALDRMETGEIAFASRVAVELATWRVERRRSQFQDTDAEGDGIEFARELGNLAGLLPQNGRPEAALRAYAEACEILTPFHERGVEQAGLFLAATLANWGHTCIDLGRLELVQSLLDRARDCLDAIVNHETDGWKLRESVLFGALGRLAHKSGDPLGAARWHRRAVQRALRESGQERLADRAVRTLRCGQIGEWGAALCSAGRLASAAAVFRAGAACMQHLFAEEPASAARSRAMFENNLAMIALTRGDLSTALSRGERAEQLHRDLADEHPSAYATQHAMSLGVLSRVLLALNEPRQSEEAASAAVHRIEASFSELTPPLQRLLSDLKLDAEAAAAAAEERDRNER